jgi:bifunctional non-homologous end joining protein LigD
MVEPASSSQQLSLRLGGPAEGAVPALPLRLGFPVATEGGRPFDDDERFFEPWWPGAPAFLRRLGDHVELRTEYLSDPLAVFPELRPVAEDLAADGVIVEGTLLALDAEGRPDARLLRRHLTGATTTDELVEGAFVASDLPYIEGHSLARQPFVERRRRLASVLPSSSHCALGPGLVGEGVTLSRAVAALGLEAISARRLDGRWRAGSAGDDWLRLHVAEPPSLPTRPFLVLLERLPLGE